MYSKFQNTKGLTLIEVLVTAIIGAIVASAIVTFINITSSSTGEMAALQVLQQESSMISELFLRKVRAGKSIWHFSESEDCFKEPGGTEVDNISRIRVNYQNSDDDIEFKIDDEDNTFKILENKNESNISTRLCGSGSASKFTIQPFGEGVQLKLALEYGRKGETYTYTETIGSVRCKNK